MPSVSCSQRGERRREGGVADDAVEDADRGDADLHHREPLGRVVVQGHRMAGARIARFDHDLQPRLAAGGERHLRHGEQGVQEDQEEQEGNVHARAQRCRAGSVAESSPCTTSSATSRAAPTRSTGCSPRSASPPRATAIYVLGDLVNRGPRFARRAAPAARPRRRRALRPRQPRLAPARRRRRRAAAASQRHARRHPRRARPRGLARVAAPSADGGASRRAG